MARGPKHGAGHKRARPWWVARYVPGRTRCAIGGEILTVPREQAHLLDLAHNDAKPGEYLGLACQHHNRSAWRSSPFARPRNGGSSASSDSEQQRRTNATNSATNNRNEQPQRADREAARRARVEQRERERRRRHLRLIITPDEGER